MLEVQKKWNEDQDGTIGFNAIRKKYPDTGYRLVDNYYASGEVITGSMRKARLYVISGSARIKLKKEIYLLNPGDVIDTSEGKYCVEVLGQQPFHHVLVFELPAGFNTVKTVPNKCSHE